ncbi:MAG: hypothetical protein AAFY88_01500, partial [Acidobacteriota bacterium]
MERKLIAIVLWTLVALAGSGVAWGEPSTYRYEFTVWPPEKGPHPPGVEVGFDLVNRRDGVAMEPKLISVAAQPFRCEGSNPDFKKSLGFRDGVWGGSYRMGCYGLRLQEGAGPAARWRLQIVDVSGDPVDVTAEDLGILSKKPEWRRLDQGQWVGKGTFAFEAADVEVRGHRVLGPPSWQVDDDSKALPRMLVLTVEPTEVEGDAVVDGVQEDLAADGPRADKIVDDLGANDASPIAAPPIAEETQGVDAVPLDGGAAEDPVERLERLWLVPDLDSTSVHGRPTLEVWMRPAGGGFSDWTQRRIPASHRQPVEATVDIPPEIAAGSVEVAVLALLGEESRPLSLKTHRDGPASEAVQVDPGGAESEVYVHWPGPRGRRVEVAAVDEAGVPLSGVTVVLSPMVGKQVLESRARTTGLGGVATVELTSRGARRLALVCAKEGFAVARSVSRSEQNPLRLTCELKSQPVVAVAESTDSLWLGGTPSKTTSTSGQTSSEESASSVPP